MKRRDLSFMAIFLPLYYLAFYMCRYSVLPVGPILTEKMKLSTGAYGLSLSALYTGYAFMLMPAGIIARKWGAKKAILAGTAGTVAANFILLIAASPLTLIVALFLNGASQGLIWPSLMQIVALNVKGTAANWIVGLMMTAAIIGPGFTFMIGGLLIFLDIWWAIFILSPLLLVALTVYFYKANIKSEISVHSIKFKWPKVNRDVLALAVTYFCFYSILRGIMGWLPSLLMSEISLAEVEAAIGSGFFPIVETMGAFLGGFISSRMKIIKPLFSVAFLSSFIVFALYVILDMPAYFAALAFFAVSMPEWLFFSRLPQILDPEEVAFASGLIDTMGYIGGSVSSFLIGYLLEVSGNYSSAIMLLALYSLIGFATSIFIRERKCCY